MNKDEFEKQLWKKIDPEALFEAHLRENEIGIFRRVKNGFQNAQKKYGEIYRGLFSFIITPLFFLAIIHITMCAQKDVPVPQIIHYIFLTAYSVAVLMMVLPPLWEISKSLRQKYEPGTYDREGFLKSVAAEKMVDEIKELIEIGLRNSFVIQQAKARTQRIARDITSIKYSTERGGKITAEIEAKIAVIIGLLGNRAELIADTLHMKDVRSMINYTVKHPECERTKDAIIQHFGDSVALTITGYKKLEHITKEMYEYYVKHNIPPREQIEQLTQLIRQFTRHNDKLMEGNLRKSA